MSKLKVSFDYDGTLADDFDGSINKQKELAKDLLIKNVYFTNREMKFSYIIKLKIDMHFDNSDAEVQLINQSCRENNHKCVVVPIEDPYWRDLVY